MFDFKQLTLFVLVFFAFASCKDDDTTMTTATTATFVVKVENVLPQTSFLASGSTGFLMPGESETISFHAGKGSFLSYAAMFVQSNDLFFGFDQAGLALYDDNGQPRTGDVSAELFLWDAGTEVNEMPGTGPNQAPRQSGPNMGMTENGNVRVVNDGFTYPPVTGLLQLSLTHDGGTGFTLTIENVSAGSMLPSPVAPGVWAVHGMGVQIFNAGQPAPNGLEALAEDGDNSTFLAGIQDATGYTSPFAPGVWVVHDAGAMPLFTNGQPDRGMGLEALAEAGDPAPLNDALKNVMGVKVAGVFNTPDGANGPGPLLPANSYSFTFDATDGDYLNLATMLVHTNDLFFAFSDAGLPLFTGGVPFEGDATSQILLWDAGTEVNEFPGAGNNQPARGGGATGTDENGNVRPVNDSFSYPPVGQSIKVTISVMR